MTLRHRLAMLLAAAVVIGGVAMLLIRPAPPRVAVGAMAPDFRALDVATGKMVSLRDTYRGSVTLVNIWGTWCVPCVHEMPAMDSVYRALGPRGLRIAAVSVDEPSVAGVRAFVAAHQISFDVLNDSTGVIKDLYQTTGVPESFLLDRGGRIVRIVVAAGPWNSAENRRIIEDLLAAPAN